MPDPLLPGPLWLAGCGNMAGAMLARWLEEGVDPAHVSVIRPSGSAGRRGRPGHHRLSRGRGAGDRPARHEAATSSIAVAPALAPILDRETILVSILAGVELASLRARFPAPRTIVRAMPNLPVRIGKGVIGLASDSDDSDRAGASVTGLMATLGHAEWFEDEASFELAERADRRRPRFPVPLHRRARRGGGGARPSLRAGARLALADGRGRGRAGRRVRRRSRNARPQGGEPGRHHRGGARGARRRSRLSDSSGARSKRRAGAAWKWRRRRAGRGLTDRAVGPIPPR